MKIAGKIKKGSAWLLALTFMLSGMVGSTVQAASGIETDRGCSVSFVLDGDIEEEFIELKSLPVSVKLYRVAEVDVSGDYTALEGYEDLGLDGISSETTAADWEAMGKKASETVKALQAEPDAEGILENGAGKMEGLMSSVPRNMNISLPLTFFHFRITIIPQTEMMSGYTT